MSVTVGGTSITFNDGSVQSTAAGAPTTAQVLSATAGASVGAVGTYAHLTTTGQAVAVGATIAGSSLRYSLDGLWLNMCGSWATANPGLTPFSSAPSGTWRCMGFASNNVLYNHTLFLRIS
jgi:hypothetical protein